jgi:nucleoside-diphosphate-sugar epimerase
MPAVIAKRITVGMLMRMGADAAMIHAALVAALAARLFGIVAFEDPNINTAAKAREYVQIYLTWSWPLAAICLVVFLAAGFYTFGRYYQGRYKALVITQAVCVSYLLFGFLETFFIGVIRFPRIALVLACVLSILLLVSARLWTHLWEHVIKPERESRVREPNGCGGKTLVIGGAGYIGSALLPKLLDQGRQIRLLDSFMFGEEPIQNVIDHPNLDILRGDFRHVENVVSAMRDVDTVVHLGAIVGDPACSLDEHLTIDINLSATRMIAELARASHVRRFFFASTCSVYGACDEMLNEHSEVRPVSLYGNTKLASERVLQGLATPEFTPTIFRFATIYGLSGRTRFDLVVNLLTAKAKIDGEITVFGGDQWRPFCHVDDAARAVAMALDAPAPVVANEVFNVGSNSQNLTIADLGRLIHEQVVSANLVLHPNDDDPRNYRVDFKKIRNRLGFEPQWTIEDGVHQVLEAIANGEVTDYQDVRYSNVKHLSQDGTNRLARDNWAHELIRSLSAG